ncbi:hypothetical protein QBC35DRAFT_523314 [Podospora australis]|uniref:Uncharacterized protein n=1 Tax=Podospora australis TaxID=1536484 RepID=A0AAN6WT52_9PEZI|nr:hypothetical protein QBC35DRAFT_523314 [Podospora australis]
MATNDRSHASQTQPSTPVAAQSYTPPKRFYVALPQLALDYADYNDQVKVTSKLRKWHMCLKTSLARHELCRYLVDDVPPPNNDKSSKEYKDWRNDCFDVIELILASVQGMVLDMSNVGWYPESDNPRHIYSKVFEAFGLEGPEDL